jgi:multiple sugar transport system substrate-binding protein
MSAIDRRSFLSLLGLAGTSLALSGCVGESAPAPESASTLKAADPGSAKGDVSYWNHFTGEDERKGFEKVTSGFQQTYPDVKLKVESLPNEDFMTKFTTAVQSGSVPNAAMVHVSRVNDMVGMRGLIDITEPVSSWQGQADIDAKILSPFQRDGKTYAVPVALFVDWVYYRVDWLEQAGIRTPPRTWAEFREAAKELTDVKRERFGWGMRGGAGGGEAVIKLIRSFNGPLVNGDGKPSLDQAAVETALEQYTAPYTKDKSVPPSAPNDGYNQIFQSFLTGRTGMLMHHTGSLQSVSKGLKPSEQVMTMPMPKSEAEIGWVQPLGNGLMTLDGAENSLAWLEYWGSAKPQVDFLTATGYFPASTTAQQDPSIAANPMFAAALKQVEIGVTPEYFKGFQGWQDNTVLVQAQSVLVGKTPIAQAAKTIVADFTATF